MCKHEARINTVQPGYNVPIGAQRKGSLRRGYVTSSSESTVPYRLIALCGTFFA